jgi:hypothetical protein
MVRTRTEFAGFTFGAIVKVRKGFSRKPWEWIGNIQLISGDMAEILWRVIPPGSNGKHPVSRRRMVELELVGGEPVSGALPGWSASVER